MSRKRKKALLLGLLAGLGDGLLRAGDLTGTVSLEGAEAAGPYAVWIDGALKGPAPEGRRAISQKGMQFTPTFSVVVAGQTVQMPNDDDVAHNVFSHSPAKKFNLGIYLKGESRSVSFEKPGVVDMFCSIHRHMNAKILVVPNPFYAVGQPGTPYRIKGVPAGSYTVKVFHPDFPERSIKVAVPADGQAKADFTLTK